MGDIVEFNKAKKERGPAAPSSTAGNASPPSIKRNWHVLAVELYANGYTSDFFSKMNRAARRELIIKSLPPNERHFFLLVLNDRDKLLGKKCSYGFESKNEQGFDEWELTTLLQDVSSKCHLWARTVKLNLQNLENQQAEISSELRLELIADAFKREVNSIQIDLNPAQVSLSNNISQTDLVDAVQTYLERASSREKSIITNLYNMDGPKKLKTGKRLNYNSVAKLTGYSARQVSNTHKKALRRAKHPYHKRFLLPFASQVNPVFVETGAELFICDIFQLR